MTLRVREAEKSEWEEYVKATNRHKSWNYYSCLDAESEKRWIKPRRLVIENRNGPIIMIQSKIMMEELNGKKYVLEEIGGVYGSGIEIFSNNCNLVKNGINALINFLDFSSKKFDYYLLRIYTTEENILLNVALRKLGLYPTEIQTPIIILKGRNENEIFNSLKSSTRRAIRQAEKRGTKVIIKENKFSIGNIEHLIDKKKIGSLMSDKAILSQVTEKSIKNGYLKVFLAKVDGKVVAFAYITTYNSVLGYPLGNMDREYSYYRPANAIQWSVIKYGIKNNYKEYNMVNAPPENSEGHSITKFKLGYKPILKRIYEYSLSP